MKIYQLVRYTYDYYERENTIDIGLDREALIAKHCLKVLNLFDSWVGIRSLHDTVIELPADHDLLAGKEKVHCMIIEWEV